jgi:hypothetical protein
VSTVFPQQIIARAVDRARWVRYHAETSRLMVWRTGERIEVYDVETGRSLDTWRIADGVKPSLEVAAALVEERVNAGY